MPSIGPEGIALCQRCPFDPCTQFVPTEGLLSQTKLVVIAEAPGEEEVKQQRPLIGPAGREFRQAAASVGIDLTQCLLLNTVKCRPPNNKKPLKPHSEACRPYVEHIIAESGCKRLLLLGDVAMKAYIAGATTDHLKISEDRGYVYPSTMDGVDALLTFHPSFIRRVKNFEKVSQELWLHDLRRAWQWVNGLLVFKEDGHYCLKVFAESLAAAAEGQGIVAVDIETTGLNPQTDKILGIAFCFRKGHALSFDWPTPNNHVWFAIHDLLANDQIVKVFQNGLFDTSFLVQNGMTVNNYKFDTRYAMHITIPDAPQHLRTGSLKVMSSLYTDFGPYKHGFKEFYKTGKLPSDPAELQRLACLDVDATLQVAEHLRKEVHELGLGHYMYDVLMPILPTLRDMYLRGIRVDTARLGRLQDELKPRVLNLEAKYPELNLNSPSQIGKHLSNLGFTLPNNPTGTIRVDEAALRKWEDNEIVADIMQHRRLSKTYKTFVKGIWNRLHGGRIHALLDPVGTATGRLSSSDPDMQNIPEEMRGVFIPDPGHIWAKADYSQIELHVAGLVYGDYALLRDLSDGVDVHQKQADLCGIPRRKAKSIVFGVIYGRTPRAIALSFGILGSEAEKWHANVLRTYPDVRKGQERLLDKTKKLGYVETAFGNRRYTNEALKIINHPIQGGAAGIMNRALAKIAQTDLQPLTVVHDEIDFQVPTMSAPSHLKIITMLMSSAVVEYNGYCFPVGISCGANWGDLK